MDENQIKGLVDSVVALYREKKGGYKQSNELPEYHDTYRLSVEMMEAIRIHAVKGVFPDKLLSERSPNQTEEELNYARKVYKQITLPVYVDLISTIQRSFNPSNWFIEYTPDDSEDSIKNYLERDLINTPLQMDLNQWFKSVVPDIKELDSMGCVVIKPYYIPVIEQDGESIISGDRFEPVPFYYNCSQVVAYQENEYYLFELKEKSNVKIGDRVVKDGLVYEFYDRNAIWKIIQVGNKKDYQFEYIPYYVHEYDQIPVIRLMGKPNYTESGELYYASPFLYVTDILDEAILDSSYLRMIKNKSGYPYRIMLADICDATLNVNGEILNCSGGHFNDLTNLSVIPCKTCNGTGRKNRISPLGEMLLTPSDMFGDGDSKINQPAMSYVEPTVTIPEFLRNEISRSLDQARAIMHLKTTNTEVTGSEDMTATAKVMDEKAKFSFIKSIRDQIATIKKFTIKWITLQRYGKDYPVPTLIYTDNFDLKGEEEYLNDIGDAVDKGVPQVAVDALTIKYLQSLFYNSGDTSKAYEVIVEADRLFTMSDDDIILKQGRGLIAPYEVILHDSAVTFIRELIQEDPNYLDRDLSEKITRLIAKAQAKAAEVKPTTSAVSVVDRILNPNA